MSKKTPNPIDRHVGARVRVRRMLLGMSQTKLGDALDLTFQQVQKYEKGVNRIGASRLAAIATILQVPVGFFFEGAPKQGPGGVALVPAIDTNGFLTSSDGLAILRAWPHINPRVRRQVARLSEELAETGRE